MNYKYPLTIENCIGEKIIFQSSVESVNGDKVLVEAFCKPHTGPAMHTHFKQEEELTVVSGKMGYQLFGQEPKSALEGETILFKRGTPHKFWADGNEPLYCKGWIQPANTKLYFFFLIFVKHKINQAKVNLTHLTMYIY